MDCTRLDELMLIKKKGDASKACRDSFYVELVNLLKEEGYTKQVEIYLFNGFSFSGALPIADFLQKEEDRWLTYSKITNGDLFNQSKFRLTTFKLEVNLLSYLLNRMPEETRIIEDIIRKLPSLSVSQGGIAFNETPKILEKYFLLLIDPETKFPNLDLLKLTPLAISRFKNLLITGLDAYNPKVKEKEHFKKLSDWIANNNNGADPLDSVKKDENLTSGPVDKTNKKELQAGKEKTWRDGISVIESYIKKLEIQNKFTLAEKEKLENDSYDLRTQIKVLLNGKDELNNRITKQSEIVEDLRSAKNLLEGKVSNLEKIIEQKDIEIEERKRYSEIVGRDEEKKKDEVLNRLAAKLKFEYKDFLNAKNLEMSIDLGENLRLQLDSIFDILNKNGIQIK